MSESAPDRRVPAYLGRVLDADGEPAGTCFQLTPAIVATAWHVLNEVGAGALDAKIAIDPLAGGESQAGTVVAIDPPADLALVRLNGAARRVDRGRPSPAARRGDRLRRTSC